MKSLRRALVDIDTQFDFIDPAGRLYVPGAEKLLVSLEKLFDFAQKAAIPILSSADDHPPDDPEFAEFGPHCVHGTAGQQKLSTTTLPRSRVITPQEHLPAGSLPLMQEYDQLIFTKSTLNVFDNPHFSALVDRRVIEEYVVFGVATEICVRIVAEGLLDRNLDIIIVSDAVAAIDPNEGARLCRTLTHRGVVWRPTDEVVRDIR